MLVSGTSQHRAFLRDDGSIASWGFGPAPAPPPGITYTQVGVGGGYAFAIASRSDGQFVVWGDTSYGQGLFPTLAAGVDCVQLSCGSYHTLARLSDGNVVAWFSNNAGQCNVPPLPVGITYTDVGAGYLHSTAVRSDGSLVAFGGNTHGQCNVPPLPPGLAYVQVSAGAYHTAALRSDGSAVCWGENLHGQCNVPPLPTGVHYVQVVASGRYTLARRSDGTVIGFGENHESQCEVPPPPSGRSYLEIEDQIARVGALSTYVTTGGGCGGSLPASALIPRDTPQIGRTLAVTVTNLPANLAVMITGFTAVSTVALDPFGMPGCGLNETLDLLTVVVGAANVGTFALALPADQTLLGLSLYQEALVFDAGINPMGAVMSDAAALVVGG